MSCSSVRWLIVNIPPSVRRTSVIPPDYEALNRHGSPYVRPAALIGELPLSARLPALQSATASLAKLVERPQLRTIAFGTPAYEAFALTRAQAKAHPQAALLLTKGDSLPLRLCPEYDHVD